MKHVLAGYKKLYPAKTLSSYVVLAWYIAVKRKQKKIKYTDEPLGDLRVVKNFLPPPDELVIREKSFREMAKRGDEVLPDQVAETPAKWDEEEWGDARDDIRRSHGEVSNTNLFAKITSLKKNM